jgi:CRISPR-associated endonuclease Csn1
MAQHIEDRRYRLGLDLGTGSLGWAAIELDSEGNPCRILGMGSRIFGSGRTPKEQTSLAADRRQARQMRRRRDRYIQRRTRLMHELVGAGLMPDTERERQALKNLDPYELRARGVHEPLSAHEVGRALYHLQQRRGFKSNRKADRGDSEKGAMKTAIRELDADLGNRTVGEYMYERIQRGNGARIRPVQQGSKNSYEFYIDRSMIEDEFERIWDTQAIHHPALMTAAARDRIHHAIFDQRPLKPVDPGRCTLMPEHKRAPVALVSSQLFRIYSEVNALRVRSEETLTMSLRPLTRDERDSAVDLLRSQPRVTLAALKKRLWAGRKMTLTLESGERSHILGDVVSAELGRPAVLGTRWAELSLNEQDALMRVLHDGNSDEEVAANLASLGLTSTEVEVALDAPIPEGYLRLSQEAISRVLPHLMAWDEEADAPVTYDQAVVRAGFPSHSDLDGKELFDTLPYYGRVLHRHTQDLANRDSYHVKANANPDEWEFGRVANPTVHVGLNQVRTVVNALVDRYGAPYEIHVEVARDLAQSAEARRKASSERAKNQARNEELNEQLRALGQTPTFANRLKLKLYDELAPLNHVCVLCGTPIERARLFQPGHYEVDHILPYSRTLDDSFVNKILICTRCNRHKGPNTPWEVFGRDTSEWGAIVDRAESAFGATSRKYAKFAEDAIDAYSSGEQDFIARQLTDTAYMARLARAYLMSLSLSGGDGAHPERVVAMPGRLTGLLRSKWGLNSLLSDTGEKERSDHRHHAIDAVVIALSDRKTLKAVSDANARCEIAYQQSNDEGVRKLIDDLPLPWDGFHEEISRAVEHIVVSHKPDHNERGRLHEETAYGVLNGPDKEGRYLVHQGGKEAKWRPVVPIFRQGEGPDSALPYKAYVGGSNYCIEIVRNAKGRWEGEVISTFEANQHAYQEFMRDRAVYLRQSFSGRELVMRLIAGDTIAIDSAEHKTSILRLCKLASVGSMYFAEVHEGNVDKRSGDKGTAFTMLKKNADPLRKLRARRVFVDPIGRVLDPGFQE